MKAKILLIGAFVALQLFFSCSSDESPATDTSAISQDDASLTAKIDATIGDITAIAEDQYSEQKSMAAKTSIIRLSILPECADVTPVVENNTWTRTVDFGTSGCTLNNGNVIKGKIIISGDTNFSLPNYVIHYTFQGFYHNGNLVEGNKNITLNLESTELQSETHPVLDHDIALTVTFPDGRIYDVDGTRTTEMTEGYSTPDQWNDNVFLITGNVAVTKRNGASVTHATVTPLRFVMSCAYAFPVSGTSTITKNNTTANLDFGNGACDKTVTITINNSTFIITLN